MKYTVIQNKVNNQTHGYAPWLLSWLAEWRLEPDPASASNRPTFLCFWRFLHDTKFITTNYHGCHFYLLLFWRWLPLCRRLSCSRG